MTTTLVKGRQISQAHITAYSLVTQAIADTGAVQAIALEVNGDILGFTHSVVTNNSRIYVPWDGSYEIILSGIADTSVANKHLEVWFRVGGVDVPDSNTRVHLVSTGAEMTVAVAAILDVDKDDYFELMTWGDNTGVQWLATAAGSTPTRPATPSVIVTAKCVNAY